MQQKSAVFVLSLAAAVFIMVGCQNRTLRRYSLVLPQAPTLKGAKPTTTPSSGVPPRDALSYSYAVYSADLKRYEDNLASNPTTAQQARNSIAWGLMGAIDQVYGEYSGRLFAGQGTVLLVGDVATLGLTAGAAIATKTAAKTIFGALGTAVTGVNLSINKNFFAQQAFQALAVAMEAGRGRIRQQISAGLAKNVTDYPVSAVQRDLVAYLYAGSLPGGLQEIQMEAGSTAKQTQGTQAGGTGSVLSISPTSLGFGSQTHGTRSEAKTITLTNTGSVPLSGINVSTAGTDAADFTPDNNCSASLAAGASCTISVTFTPTASHGATENATLALKDASGNVLGSVALTGTVQ